MGIGATVTWLESSRNRSDGRVRQSVRELYQEFGKSLQNLASSVALRDEQPAFHCERVALNACALGRAFNMSARELTELHWSGILHDLGKVSVPSQILLKPGALTDREYVEIKKHADAGADMLVGISPKFFNISEAVRSHHERWDGAGYPRGLVGKGIPVAGRILAIADVFEAVTNQRPYRDPMTIDTALDVLRHGAGAHFDPKLVERFVQLYAQGAILMEGNPMRKSRFHEHPLTGAPRSPKRHSGYDGRSFLQSLGELAEPHREVQS